jgi:ribosomal protein S7
VFKAEARVLVGIVARVAQGSLMDLACGTAYWMPHYAATCSRVTLFDQSERMLAEARAKADRLGILDRCVLLVGDFFEHHFDVQAYDMVIIGFFLSHLTERQETLVFDAVRRMLTTEGQCLILESAWSAERAEVNATSAASPRAVLEPIANAPSENGPPSRGAPEFQALSEQLRAIGVTVSALASDQQEVWARLRRELAGNGIVLLDAREISDADREWLEHHFLDSIFPVLTPLAIDPAHPFPQLLNKSLNMIVQLEMAHAGEVLRHLAVVQVPRILPRLVRLPRQEARQDYVFLGHLIGHYLADLFPGTRILGYWHFRVTRNSELYIDEEEVANLLKAVENVKPPLEVRSRRVGGANYQVPMQVKPKRQQSLAIRWIIAAIRAKAGRSTALILADELMAAYRKEGEAMAKREQTIKMAEANKAFSHFAW